MKWSWNIADTPTCMTEAHDFFSYESPAGNFYDVKNYFRDGLRVNHDETMGYRLSLQPLPVGALSREERKERTAKTRVTRLVKSLITQALITISVLPCFPLHLSGFAVEV